MGNLVRDRIPEIIDASGGSASTLVLDDEEYVAALLDKLLQEVVAKRHSRGGFTGRLWTG